MAKNLVLYFSVYGTAKMAAEEIAKQTGADIQGIVPVTPYDGNREHYHSLLRAAQKEHDEDQRPAIRDEIAVADYDRIFIGYPMWRYTFPMIIYTLFDKYDFGGKTIIPFNTHMGSMDGGTYETIRELEPEAKVLEGLPVEMRDAEKGSRQTVAKWLKKLPENKYLAVGSITATAVEISCMDCRKTKTGGGQHGTERSFENSGRY